MRTLADLVLIAFCVLGCLDKDKETHYDRTPAGFLVRWEWRKSGDAATRYVEFDAAVVRAEAELLRDFGIPPQETRNKAHTIRYEFYDSICFEAGGVLVVGTYLPTREQKIGLAYWPYNLAPDEATARSLAAVPWAVFQKSAGWAYAVYDPDRLYPALAHELAHTFGHHHKSGDCYLCLFHDSQ